MATAAVLSCSDERSMWEWSFLKITQHSISKWLQYSSSTPRLGFILTSSTQSLKSEYYCLSRMFILYTVALFSTPCALNISPLLTLQSMSWSGPLHVRCLIKWHLVSILEMENYFFAFIVKMSTSRYRHEERTDTLRGFRWPEFKIIKLVAILSLLPVDSVKSRIGIFGTQLYTFII